jgi:cytochrome P450
LSERKALKFKFNQTSASIHTFILAMVLYPDVQKKAQAELDSVVGHKRVPEFSDRLDLPYIGAIVKEVFRWIPVVSTGLWYTHDPPGIDTHGAYSSNSPCDY